MRRKFNAVHLTRSWGGRCSVLDSRSLPTHDCISSPPGGPEGSPSGVHRRHLDFGKLTLRTLLAAKRQRAMKIKLLLHTGLGVVQGPHNLQEMERDIQRLYACFGVDLTVQPGLAFKEEARSRSSILKLIDANFDLPDHVGSPAHIVIGTEGDPLEFGGAIGALVDAETRGVAVVFGEVGPADIDPAVFLQVCVHEVGHMLDLPHPGPTAESIPSAMCQAKIRAGRSISAAWAAASEPRPEGLNAFPFSPEEAGTLRTASEARAPWSGPFSHLASGSAQGDKFEISISAEQSSLSVGSPLGLIVKLTNRGVARTFPTRLDPELGSLEMSVTNPEDFTYRHAPTVLVCASENVELQPNQSTLHAVLIRTGPHGVAFPSPGAYTLQVQLGTEVSNAVTVDVKPSAIAGTNRKFWGYVSAGAPRGRSRQQKTLNSILRQQAFARNSTTAHLAYLKARQLRDPKDSAPLLDALVQERSVPLALREAACLERIWTAKRAGVNHEEIALRCRATFDDGRSEGLQKQISRWIAKEQQ